MLSVSNIRKINEQILDELRTVDSICSSHQEKMEAIERIAALKKLLSEDREVPVEMPVRTHPILEIFGVR